MTLVRGLPSAEPAGSHRPAGSSLVDWHDAGLKADAHRIQKLMRGNYSGWEKGVVRRKIIRSLVAAGVTTVLDLDAGGTSGDELGVAGLSVISIEDGRGFAAIGVARERGRRAFERWTAEAGRSSRWGKAEKFAKEGDAAFWDFMGHWSPEVRRTLIASRHMKAIAVTLMPERTPLGERLSLKEWTLAYWALLEATTLMRVRWSHAYKRQSGLDAVVFFLRPGGRRGRGPAFCEDCGDVRPPQSKAYCISCGRVRRNVNRPKMPMNEASRRHLKDWRTANPDRVRELRRQSYRRNKDAILAKQNAKYHATRVLLSPEERSARARVGAALRNARRLAAVQSTAAEAQDQAA